MAEVSISRLTFTCSKAAIGTLKKGKISSKLTIKTPFC